MNCEKSRHYLDPLVDNELSIDLTSEVMRHLDTCTQCQDEWTDITRLHDTINGALSRIPIPEGLVQRIQLNISKNGMEQQPSTGWNRFHFLPVAATVFLFILVVSIFIGVKQTKDVLVPSDLIANHQTSTSQTVQSANPEIELQRLQRTLNIEQVKLTGWTLVKVETCSIDNFPAVHLCYINSKKQMLSCYRLKHGVFDATSLKKHAMNGRIYCCGQYKDVAIIFCPNERQDSVLVGLMPERELMSIAIKNST